MATPKMEIGDPVKVPHPDQHVIGEIVEVLYRAHHVRYGVRWWDGVQKHFGRFSEVELTLE